MAGTELLIVGGGKMGEALLAGLIRSGSDPGSLAVAEPLTARRSELSEAFSGVTVTDRVVPSVGVVLATKPSEVEEACKSVALAGAQRLLSIAAGVTTAALEAHLGGGIAVVRAMPNTAAVVGAAASAVAPGASASEADVEWASSILSAVGTAVRVSEQQLDAVTGLSGSGPAYMFLVAESLVEAGVLVGLPREVAAVLVAQTMLGSARLLQESGQHVAELRGAVTSPGGTTAAGLLELELGGVRGALLSAVAAATERSRQLGEG